MRLTVTNETLGQLFDPSKRPVELEKARLETLRRGRELRERSLRRQREKTTDSHD